jgi:Domain of unknown function (DUF4936)
MRELFVYWRLERHELAAARQALQQFQHALEAEWPGLQARLLVRADGADGADDTGGSGGSGGSGHATLMETYAREEGIAPGLQADIVALGAQAAARWCRGPRHVEVFEPLPR